MLQPTTAILGRGMLTMSQPNLISSSVSKMSANMANQKWTPSDLLSLSKTEKKKQEQTINDYIYKMHFLPLLLFKHIRLLDILFL